jgi:hypothetical protein
MTKHEGMTNDQMTNDRDVTTSSFELCASLGIRHSCFVISCRYSNLFWYSNFEFFAILEQSIYTNSDQKHRAHECIALKERAIDSGQIEFLDFVFVNQRPCHE